MRHVRAKAVPGSICYLQVIIKGEKQGLLITYGVYRIAFTEYALELR
jgi:hypothetical protein